MNEQVLKAKQIVENYDGRPLRIMEVCGTHTHEIFRLGIRQMLPENIHLISGPGCPVCVTPVGYIDQAIDLALNHHCTICTFGDLIRVPGSDMSLQQARAKGAKIVMIYSPTDAFTYAQSHLDEDVVLLAVGFETTTPASCMAIRDAKKNNLTNFSALVANKTMDNAYLALKDSADAFLYPGHVSTITGCQIYRDLCEEGISGVVTGFTGSEILTALAVIIKKLEKGQPFFMNCYPRVVCDEGSPSARKIIASVMEPCDSIWRGIGNIPGSGLQIKAAYQDFDARKKYGLENTQGHPNPACRCGDILRGDCMPNECPLFGKVCTPEHPVGACMVSNEGSCSAFYKYME